MRTIFLSIFTLFLTVSVKAQMAEPVKWSFNAEKISNSEYKLTFTATIEEGWYVYSQNLVNKGPVPTKINFDLNPNIILEGKLLELGVKKEVFDQNFSTTVVRLEGKTQFVQLVRLTNNTPSVKGKLSFMTCNGEMCMPPRSIDFNIDLKK